MNLVSTPSDRLKKAMKIRNFKQSDLVEKTGINKSSISTYLSGEYKPKQDKIILLANVLEVNPSWLMGYDTPMNDNSNGNNVLTLKDERDIAKKVNIIINQIDSEDALMFDGEPLDDESKELLKISLENSMRIAKVIAKQKYTPIKYRK
ncbi:MAG: helix-turn-helix domain-containing protein [Lachnospirales bacterium]